MTTQNDVIRIKNDVNGNPRHVIHFLAFTTLRDKKRVPAWDIHGLYEIALWRARHLGGRKFHNKQYGGGIVFQAYSADEVRDLVKLAKRRYP